ARPGAPGSEDRQDRRARPRGTDPTGARPGDLAADTGRPLRTRASPLPAPPGPSPLGDQKPDPRDPDDVRPSVPADGPVRCRRPRAARSPGAARALAHEPRREPRAHRRPDPPDR